MRFFNTEVGISRNAKGGIYWTWFEHHHACCGCFLVDIGPFYFTILRGDCKL